ncbi:MAG: hypothetical protein M1834_003730 [Cirrosporium novae-zelandiae]|nr:MAG: hypothetical protein M1834_003730 [Cirrosporium novae-zelandiae]
MYGSPAAASDHFARRAMGFAFEALDHPSIATIQAIYLVTLQEWGARRGSRAFIYIAMAIRMVQMLKPAIETGSGQDFVVAETARRVLWTCFMMEQFLSSGKDRPTMLRDEDLRISLPCSEQDYHFGTPTIVPMLNGELPHAVGPDSRVSEIGEFGHMILIARLWRGVVTWIFEPSPQDNEDESQYQRLLEELYHWHDSLPARLQNRSGQIDLHITMGTGFPFAFIHCVFHCAIIFLHRRRLHLLGRQSNSTPNNNISSSSRDPWQVQTIDAIFSSASAITSLLTALESPSSQAYIFPLFTLFSSYTAATTVAYMSIRELIPQARSTSITIVRDNLRILRGMRESWALVEEWYEELGEMIKVLQNRAMGKHDGERGFGMEDEEYSSLQLSGRSQTGQSPMSVSNSPTHHLAQQLASQGTPSTTSTSLEAAAVLERMRDPRDGNGSAGGLGTPHMGPSNPQEGMAILSLYEEQLATSGDLAAFLGSEQYANGSH